MPLSAHVSTASGQKMMIAEGSRLVFGRGPGVDLAIAAGRGLSRRAGVVTAMAAGAWIANISRTHALYVEGDDYRSRLPRMEDDGEPAYGWFVHTGTAYVGSRGMLDYEQPLTVTVTGRFEGWSRQAGGVNGSVTAAGAGAAEEGRVGEGGGAAAAAGAGLAGEAWLADADGLAEGAGLADADGLADAGGLADTGGLAEGAGLAGRGGRAAGRAGGGTLPPL